MSRRRNPGVQLAWTLGVQLTVACMGAGEEVGLARRALRLFLCVVLSLELQGV